MAEETCGRFRLVRCLRRVSGGFNTKAGRRWEISKGGVEGMRMVLLLGVVGLAQAAPEGELRSGRTGRRSAIIANVRGRAKSRTNRSHNCSQLCS